jgi:hypothetical protein
VGCRVNQPATAEAHRKAELAAMAKIRFRRHRLQEGANQRAAAAARLLWDESLRQVVRQEADLDELRTRTVALLSVTAIVAGLFGSRLSGNEHGYHLAAIIVALAGFGISTLLALVILISRRGVWRFAHKLDVYLTKVRNGAFGELDVSMNLAEHFEEYRLHNQPRLDNLHRVLIAICIAVGVQVLAWAVAAI